MQGWYYVESLTGQRHDRVQTESQIATVDSCFDLVGSRPAARCSKLWSIQLVDWYSQTHYVQMVMTPDETQIQILANWPMSHAKRVTRDNSKNPEYRVVAAIRKLRTDTNCPAGKSWPNHVKNVSINSLPHMYYNCSLFVTFVEDIEYLLILFLIVSRFYSSPIIQEA